MKQTHEDLWMAQNNRNEGLDCPNQSLGTLA